MITTQEVLYEILKKLVFAFFSLFALSTGAWAEGEKTLVAYFSWSSSHNTRTMAEYIAEETGGKLFEIKPAVPYTANYNQVVDEARKELAETARPALAENISQDEMASYDTIFIGYPIWWYDAPMIIYSFLESHNFAGKKIIPFATSGGGGSGLNEEKKFRELTGTEVEEGLCLRNIRSSNARKEIQNWLSEVFK